MSSAIRISIVVPVLNSHEIVRRQLLHFDRIGMPAGVELVYVDDGSDPPIEAERPYLRILRTHDARPWTWALARNAGARAARGAYLLMCDLDYIIPRKAIDVALAFSGDKLRFKREFGVLLGDGSFTQDFDVLREYGLLESRIRTKGTRLPPHPNNFCMRRDLYWQMGGYREDLIHKQYPQGEDRWFKREWTKLVDAGKAQDDDANKRPTLYMFPNGQFCGDVDHNPFGLFHQLTRKTDENPWHKKLLEAQGA